MPTKETLEKMLHEAAVKNQKLLLTLIEIQTNPSLDERHIRAYVAQVLKEAFTIESPAPAKPKRTRKVSMPELAI